MIQTIASWVVVLVVGAAPNSALTLGTPTVETTQYTIPVLLQGGEEAVSALDFRLQYDPEIFEPVAVEAGAVAAQANKVVSANIASPGEYIVVLMGLNQETLATGEVAQIRLERIGNPDDGLAQLHLSQPTLATWEGVELDVTGSSRTVDLSDGEAVDSSPTTEEETSETAEESEDGDTATSVEPVLATIGGEKTGSASSSAPPLQPLERNAAKTKAQTAPPPHQALTGTVQHAAKAASQARGSIPTPSSGLQKPEEKNLSDSVTKAKETLTSVPQDDTIALSAQSESHTVEETSREDLEFKSVKAEQRRLRTPTEDPASAPRWNRKIVAGLAIAFIFLVLGVIVVRRKLFA